MAWEPSASLLAWAWIDNPYTSECGPGGGGYTKVTPLDMRPKRALRHLRGPYPRCVLWPQRKTGIL